MYQKPIEKFSAMDNRLTDHLLRWLSTELETPPTLTEQEKLLPVTLLEAEESGKKESTSLERFESKEKMNVLN